MDMHGYRSAWDTYWDSVLPQLEMENAFVR